MKRPSYQPDGYEDFAGQDARYGDTPRGQNPDPGTESDPLAELARLIGQTDPFSNFGREGAVSPQANAFPPAPEIEAFPAGADPSETSGAFDDPVLPSASGPSFVAWRRAAPPNEESDTESFDPADADPSAAPFDGFDAPPIPRHPAGYGEPYAIDRPVYDEGGQAEPFDDAHRAFDRAAHDEAAYGTPPSYEAASYETGPHEVASYDNEPPMWGHHDSDPRMKHADAGAPPIPAFLKNAHPAGHAPHPAQAGPYDDVLYGHELPLAREAEPNRGPHAPMPDDAYGSPYGGMDDRADTAEQGRDRGHGYDEYAPYPDSAEGPEHRAPRRNGGLITIGAVVVLALVGIAGAYAYRSVFGVTRTGPPPLIKADTTPNKIVPPRKSGEQNGKLIYDRIGTNPSDSQLVSREEQPVDVAGTQQTPRVVFPPLNQTNEPAQDNAAPNGGAQDELGRLAAESSREQSSPFDSPKKIRTLTIRPDSPSAPEVSAAPSAQAPAPRSVEASAEAEPVEAAPEPVRPASNPVRTQRITRAPETSAAPGPIDLTQGGRVASVATPAPAISGGYLVQVSSQRSDGDARTSFRNLQRRYPALLGSREPVIRQVDLGSRGVYYRAMVGPFASSGDASQLCSDLKAAGGNCVIQRN